MSSTRRIYIAGPMTGLPDFNYPAFHAAAAALRAAGHVVENPAENTLRPGSTWMDYMRVAIPQLMQCESIALLPGWAESRGTRIELQLAQELDMRVMYYLNGGLFSSEDVAMLCTQRGNALLDWIGNYIDGHDWPRV